MREQRIEKLMQMLAENGEDAFALYGLAMEYEGMEMPAKAATFYEKVLQLDPTRVAAYYRLATIKYSAGYDAEALALLQRGLEVLGNSSDQKTKNEFKSLIADISM